MTPAEVPAALAALEAARAAGHWLAGFLPMSWAMRWKPRLGPACCRRAAPLLLFGVYDGPRRTAAAARMAGPMPGRSAGMG